MPDVAVIEPSAAAVRTESNEAQAAVEAVADNFTELMRSFTRARARMLAAAQHDESAHGEHWMKKRMAGSTAQATSDARSTPR